MSFAKDRDLLVLEPSLFQDVAYLGQTLVSGTDGSLSGTELFSASSNFEAAGIEGGHVVNLSGGFEVAGDVGWARDSACGGNGAGVCGDEFLASD